MYTFWWYVPMWREHALFLFWICYFLTQTEISNVSISLFPYFRIFFWFYWEHVPRTKNYLLGRKHANLKKMNLSFFDPNKNFKRYFFAFLVLQIIFFSLEFRETNGRFFQGRVSGNIYTKFINNRAIFEKSGNSVGFFTPLEAELKKNSGGNP